MTPPRVVPFLFAAACAGGGGDPPDAGGAAELFVNEVLPANAAKCADEAGEYDDWVELHNAGDAPVALDGWSVTDDEASPRKGVLEGGLSIPAGGFLLLWFDDAPWQGPGHLPFKLNAEGEQVLLFDPGGALVDRFAWTAAVDDVSYARLPDGTGAHVACAAPTCGAANGGACPP